MMVEALAGEVVPKEQPLLPEWEAVEELEVLLFVAPLDPPLLEELEELDELLPAAAEEEPPPPDALLELLLELPPVV
jgi:hypothetical protein